jgi:hypothetical protein
MIQDQTDDTGQRSNLAKIASADMVRTKGLGLALCSEISIDGGLQVGGRSEDTAADALPGHLGEGVFHGVEPEGRDRGEVERPARMARQPSQHPRFREGRLFGGLWVA